jgi:hypothetical protein
LGLSCELECTASAELLGGQLKAQRKPSHHACGNASLDDGGVCFELTLPSDGLNPGVVTLDLIVDDVGNGRRVVDDTFDVELSRDSVTSCGRVDTCLNGATTSKTEAYVPASAPAGAEATEPPPSPSPMVSAGADHSCAAKSDGTLVCWGNVLAAVPEGSFRSVSAGDAHSCAIGLDGLVTCWGSDLVPAEALAPPLGAFDEIALGTGFGCGIRPSGQLECWGKEECHLPYDVGGLGHESLDVGGDTLCATIGGDAVACTGGRPDLLRDAVRVAVGGAHVCVLSAEGFVTCAGDDTYGQLDAPVGSFIEITAGNAHTCALDAGLGVVCWGAGSAPSAGPCSTRPECGQSAPPADRFVQIAAGAYHVCGITETGSAVCWGDDEHGKASPPVVSP